MINFLKNMNNKDVDVMEIISKIGLNECISVRWDIEYGRGEIGIRVLFNFIEVLYVSINGNAPVDDLKYEMFSEVYYKFIENGFNHYVKIMNGTQKVFPD